MLRLFARIFLTLLLFSQCSSPYAIMLQDRSVTTISGTVKSADDNQPVANLNFTVPGKILGIVTDSYGNFEISVNQEPPFTVRINADGFKMKEIEITVRNTTGLDILLEKESNEDVLDDDFDNGGKDEISPSRINEPYLKAPLTIGQIDHQEIKNSPSGDYFQALSHLKGVDFTVNSMLFPVINSRGFNSTANNRIIHLADGVDLQSPAFNIPIGNLISPQILDVESVEYIAGPTMDVSSAHNGTLSIKTKSPFRYQGLSIRLRSGLNHLGGKPTLGEPDRPQASHNTQLRFAHAITDRFAFKINVSYSAADDWRRNDFSDRNRNLQGSRVFNPARDEIHSYGDEELFNIRSLLSNPDSREVLVSSLSSETDLSVFQVLQYVNALPSQPVTRTGYPDFHLTGHDAENFKTNASLHYRLTNSVEASYMFNFGQITSSLTDARRIRLKNFNTIHHMIEFKSNHLNLRAYGAFEDSGDSYFVDMIGVALNESYLSSDEWLSSYGVAYLRELFEASVAAQDGFPNFNFSTIQALLRDPSMVSQFNNEGRTAADLNRISPGSDQFKTQIDELLQNSLPEGARFKSNSRLYHIDGVYNFRNQINFAEVAVGANFRLRELRSNQNLFDDAGGVQIHKWGGFLKASRNFLDNRLDLTAFLRYDKHENFDGQLNPGISGVFKTRENQFLRASFRMGSTFPTAQSQYTHLNAINTRGLGGLPRFAERYRLSQNSYTLDSVFEYQNALLSGNAFAEDKLVPFTFKPVKPEKIRTVEVGYKGLVGNSLFFDAAYYYNIFNGFNSRVAIRQINSDLNNNGIIEEGEIFHLAPNTNYFLFTGNKLNTFHIYTNIDHTLEAHGILLGLEFLSAGDFEFGINYNWNSLISDLTGFRNDFNTPKHKLNVTFGNPQLMERLGFTIDYQWQNAFRWESSFINADVEALSTIDIQLNVQIPEYHTTFKIGGTNVFNNRHRLNGGGPAIGAFYYASLTFDQLFR